MLRSAGVVLLGRGKQLAARESYPEGTRITDSELAALRPAWQGNDQRSEGPVTLSGSNWFFVPLSTARGTVGVLAITRNPSAPAITSEERSLLNALTELAGVAIERPLPR